jgi:transmembrane sensor
MKSKASNHSEPLISPGGGTSLDWPLELGLKHEFFNTVKARRQKRRLRKGLAKGALFVAAGAWLAAWGIPYLRDTGTLRTPAARRQAVTLNDGSRAELNAHAQLAMDFRHGQRVVRLEKGEAFFSVAKDPGHPFIVQTRSGNVQVTGTEFNVRVCSDRETEVTLLDGGVTVEGPARSLVRLVPGQQFDSLRAEPRALTPLEMDHVLTWRQGRIAFDGLTLAEVAERLADYHGKKIMVAPEVAGLRPGGTLPIDDLPVLLRDLASTLPIKVVQAEDGSYQLLAP